MERYTIFIRPTFSAFANNCKKEKFSKLNCKTLREARQWFSILSDGEKKESYIYDNVKKKKVE